MIKEGTDAAAVTDEQISAVADDLRLHIKEHGITSKRVARQVGYAEPTVSDFLNGKYKGKRGQVAIDLEAWLVEDIARRARPQTTQFVWTNVAQLIKATAGYCLDEKTIGLIYGQDASGIGKTMALQAVHQWLGPRRSTFVSLNKVSANPRGLCEAISRALGTPVRFDADRMFHNIVENLRGRSHLLIIDEIHSLCFAHKDRPLHILKDLYKETGTAQLWCGTADMDAYLSRQMQMRKGTLDETLVQIQRRLFPQIDLMESVRTGGTGEPLVTLDQIHEMFKTNQLRITPAAAKFLMQLANTPNSGGLGTCEQLVKYATVIFGHAIKCIDEKDVKNAMKRGSGQERARARLQLLDENVMRMQKVG